MKNIYSALAVALLLCACQPSYAGTSIDVRNADGTIDPLEGASGQVTTTLLPCDDETNSVCRVEQQFSYCVDAIDKICKTTAGLVHSVSCWGMDSASVAGRVRLVDDATVTGTAANEIWGAEIAGLTLQNPIGDPAINAAFTRGLHWDFTTTTDVKCRASFR